MRSMLQQVKKEGGVTLTQTNVFIFVLTICFGPDRKS
jgi:hypothetical protein